MTDKKAQTKAGATELSEEELKDAQGAWSWGETNEGIQLNKATPTVNKATPILRNNLDLNGQDIVGQKVKKP